MTASILRHPAEAMEATLRKLALRAENYGAADNYGSGKLIEEFEHKMAVLLGKPAALFLPSGTLAQGVALKIHTEQRKQKRIALHPTSHLMLHEHQGYQELWGLQSHVLGQPEEVLRYADFPNELDVGALVLELPMREIGGQLPSWDDLQSQVAWARERNCAVHIDGARLWHCPAYYKRSLGEISALADSVYVSLYKDIGGIAGAILAGESDFIAQAKVWSRRAGGNLISFYPYILAAQQGLDDNLASISSAVDYARYLGPLLATIPGVRVNPETPQSAMFHLHIERAAEDIARLTERYLSQHDVQVLPQPRGQDRHGYSICEISVGRSTMEHPPEFWLAHVLACLAHD